VHVKVLARLFRGKMLAMLMHAHDAGELKFFNTHAGLATRGRSSASSPRCGVSSGWSIARRRSQGPSRCCAISPVTPIGSPSRTAASLQPTTTRLRFRWKDYRTNGPDRWKTMKLHPHEFIRRFLLHVLPKGFHRIRHYGLFASANRAESIATARALLNVAPPAADPQEQPDVAPDSPRVLPCPCPRCGARMIVIEVFAPGCEPKWRPTPSRIDTS